MPSFFDRYQAGEREQVWADLNSLGAGVHDKKYLSDAYAVAQETMRRARGNVETLILRLEKLGYEFLTTGKSASEALDGLGQAMAMMQAVNQLTAGSRPNPHVDKLRERSRSMMESPLFRGLLGKLEQRAATPEPESALKNFHVLSPPHKDVAKSIEAFETEIGGPLPLSLRAWCEIVGSVSLIGTHPVLCFRERAHRAPMTMFMSPSMFPGRDRRARLRQMRAAGMNVVTELPGGQPTPLADPLVVEGEVAAWESEYEVGEARSIPLAPDDLHKADISGDAYYMDVPSASADAPFLDWHKANFVDYLRTAFRWGGFPGWERYPERPEKELAYLAKDLLEI